MMKTYMKVIIIIEVTKPFWNEINYPNICKPFLFRLPLLIVKEQVFI